ncbi:hypothetical protein GQX73_g4894 [Xylaria multiplex]|uniref:Uncharacterized protein n=1 Tax=Xylaria multiplex TaxID=323545 RepID=A0A7C8IV18_9PEZI|nr:hypothetical protein GQX73_g4894 [Xylaria multiplex]
MSIDVRALQKTDLDNHELGEAITHSGAIDEDIFKFIDALKAELKAALNELRDARLAVIANNTKFLGELQKLPKHDSRDEIRKWAIGETGAGGGGDNKDNDKKKDDDEKKSDDEKKNDDEG